eukprot:TRINITY_DN15402_c0_g1_i3.p1 TRINITY_DN15402_c0_g1~~TRINITY_DN15402_c0_g1_i3.p1  ORF type:complete len:519 (+),score=53.84 TRINITY_DN15402_c0_g1_i3:87-1559(+)
MQPIFWHALLLSVPSGLLTYARTQFVGEEWHALEIHGTVFSSLSMLISVFVAFRASQAYSRYWDGATALYSIRGHFIDVVSNLFAYTRGSQSSPAEVLEFRHTIIRLFSLLETLCLCELSSAPTISGREEAFHFEIIDPAYFDKQTITAIKEAHFPVDLVVQWIQGVIVDAMHANVISTPAPICTRVFQELQSGISKFDIAMRITELNIPFPYTAATRLVLCIFWLIMPFAAGGWSQSPAVCGILAAIQIFALNILNGVAGEMENPFGTDVNDLDIEDGHLEFNHRLWLMLTPAMNRLPETVSHLKNATEYCPFEILERQATWNDLFVSEPLPKFQALFKHSKENLLEDSKGSLRWSVAVSAEPPSQRDNVVPTCDTGDVVLGDPNHAIVSSDAISTSASGTDVLIIDKKNPLTEVHEKTISGDAISTSASGTDVLIIDKKNPLTEVHEKNDFRGCDQHLRQWNRRVDYRQEKPSHGGARKNDFRTTGRL